MRERLIGHWHTPDGVTDYYFDREALVMLDNGRRQDQTWRVIHEDPASRTLEVQITVPATGGGHAKRLVFDRDHAGISYTITMMGHTIGGRWQRVDDRVSPDR